MMDDNGFVRSFFTSRAERNGGCQAVCDYDTGLRYTYADLGGRANSLANFLVKEFGIKKGDRIGICAQNNMVYIDLFYATIKTGAITTAYNAMMKGEELAYLLRKEAPRVIFFDPIYLEKLDTIKGQISVEHYIPLDKTYDALLEYDSTPAPYVDISGEDIIQLMHTGGTTGTPKAAMISARAVMCNAIGQQNTYGLTSKDVMFGCLPMLHTATWHTVTMPLLYAGGRLIFARKFQEESTFDVIEREKITMLWGVPAIYRRLMERPRFPNANFSSISRCRCGAAPPPLELMEAYWKKGVTFCNGYGMTETSPGNLAMPVGTMSLDQIRAKRTSCGKLMIYNEAKIVDDRGRAVPTGESGELLFRGPTLFSGYWQAPEETASAMVDGWMHTGDVARVDEDGFFYIVGRKKNMYITNGENIFPLEIESILSSHPAVKEVCVIGIPDPCRGEVGKAVMIPNADYPASVDELRAFVSARLPSIKCPKYYTFSDVIPKNSIGKVDYSMLHTLYGKPE